MYAGSREFTAYAQTVRRTYWAKLLEQGLEANVDGFLSGVVIADLAVAPSTDPAAPRARRRIVAGS